MKRIVHYKLAEGLLPLLMGNIKMYAKRYELGAAITMASSSMVQFTIEKNQNPALDQVAISVIEFMGDSAFQFALSQGIDKFQYPTITEIEQHIKSAIEKEYETDSLDAVAEDLKAITPEFYNQVDPFSETDEDEDPQVSSLAPNGMEV